MDWTEIAIEVTHDQIEQASSIAQLAAEGIYIEDYSQLEAQVEEIAHINLIDQNLLDKDRSKAIIHIYVDPTQNPIETISYISRLLETQQIAYNISTNSIKEQDWATAWQKYYHPMKVGKHIIICPEWEDCDINTGDVLLKINPGMAFGTGTHETTRLCLELLEKHVKKGSSILDIGCGSGILTVASSLLGADKSIGVDIDELAVKTAYENAQLNEVSEKTEFICGDLTEKVTGKYDLICANIVAEVIIRLSTIISDFMHKDSVLICSGIIDEFEQDVIQALESSGFCIIEIIRENGWVALTCSKL